MNLTTKLDQIKGVGPKTAEQLASAGLRTVGDIITFLPRKHEDYSEVSLIADLSPGKRTIKATCESIEVKRVRRGMTVTTAVMKDDSGKVRATWFNQPYRAMQLKADDEFYLSGDFSFQYNRYQFTNPSVEKVSDMPIQTDRLLPVYRQLKGLKNQLVRKILVELKPFITMLPETLPPTIVARENLLPRAGALLAMHFPRSGGDITRAKERLAYEELFALLLASRLQRTQQQRLIGRPIPFDAAAVKSFVDKLPFTLTSAQRLAAWEIIQDFAKSQPMNRLLQGDVGSGKTVVAGIAMLSAARSQVQSAFMAPTEVLARQHADTLAALLEPFGVRVGLLIGAVKGEARRHVLRGTKHGEIDVLIGTHALFQEAVEFHRLGFVVIDEQHRFGVAQRQKLLDKSRVMPHLLTMTATPIPRSLQLTVFGDLDVSILAERPQNRKPIVTKIVSPVSASRVYSAIDAEIQKGRQAYVICPVIDESASGEKKSVEAEYRKLRNSVFGHREIGVLHGRMTPHEKDTVMNDFKAGRFDILVSTTVVEVGVDVPNATAMLIENADQFGLAQLHQLRGRVGRSEHQSYCYLMMSDSKKPSQRLREIESSNDGFYLAEVDLELRGPGEIYGRAQHGELNLSVARLGDSQMISRAGRGAKAFIDSGEDLLQYKQLADDVSRYQRLTTLN